jgi:hypothetical protein
LVKILVCGTEVVGSNPAAPRLFIIFIYMADRLLRTIPPVDFAVSAGKKIDFLHQARSVSRTVSTALTGISFLYDVNSYNKFSSSFSNYGRIYRPFGANFHNRRSKVFCESFYFRKTPLFSRIRALEFLIPHKVRLIKKGTLVFFRSNGYRNPNTIFYPRSHKKLRSRQARKKKTSRFKISLPKSVFSRFLKLNSWFITYQKSFSIFSVNSIRNAFTMHFISKFIQLSKIQNYARPDPAILLYALLLDQFFPTLSLYFCEPSWYSASDMPLHRGYVSNKQGYRRNYYVKSFR